MSGEIVALIIGALIVGGCGLGFVWAGRGMIAGRLHPNMGYQNACNTTPGSWREMQVAVGGAIVQCGWQWVAAGIITALFAPAGAAALTIATAVLIVRIARASKLLEPLER